MGRLRLGVPTALVLALASPAPAGAAEITHLQSAEPGDPFALSFSMRWDRDQERATISRERAAPGGELFPGVVDRGELRYTRVRNDLVTRFALALYQDVELHVEIPYSLADDTTWRFRYGDGIPGADSSIATNSYDAMGQPCPDSNGDGQPGPCPLFPVSTSDTTVYHGGALGDVRAGVAWGIFNDRRDDTKPTWVVGLDVTFPTAKLYDPAKDRRPNWGSPYFAEARRGPAGEKVWRWDLNTTLSRRFGPVDPYFRAHVTAVTPSSETYSNCEHADGLWALPVPQMTLAGAQNCKSPGWKDEAGAQLPWIGGLTFGAELVPWEDPKEDQKVSFDFRVYGDYTSQQRFYNELTDASGKLHMTEGYLTMGAYAGLYVRTSRWVLLQTTASLSTRTAHWLSGESLGKTPGSVPQCADLSGASPCAGMNPNYDWRYDAPGNRFRISEVSVFSLSVAGVLQF